MPNVLNRLTVRCQVFHQNSGQEASRFPLGFCRILSEKSEQVYTRLSQIATEDWKTLDPGWIEQCSAILIHNVEGRDRRLRKLPVPEEERIELVSEEPLLVLPGEFQLLTPAQFKAVQVRSPGGSAEFNVTFIPG